MNKNISQEFINKLIKDTSDGLWDGGWSSDAVGGYTFVAPKQILTKSSFFIITTYKGEETNEGGFIFPNGFLVNFSHGEMNKLKDVVKKSLERTVIDWMNQYDGPIEADTQDQTAITNIKTSINQKSLQAI